MKTSNLNPLLTMEALLPFVIESCGFNIPNDLAATLTEVNRLGEFQSSLERMEMLLPVIERTTNGDRR